MESASTSASQPAAGTASGGDKGLKTGALGFVSNVVIGVASTAPGYSLAAVLGFVAAEVAFQSPAILWVAFLPMLLIAASYYYMNRDDPDCGTSLHLGDQRDGAAAGLADRLGDPARLPDRDGQPRPDRRPLHLPALRLGLGRRIDRRSDRGRRRRGSP